MHLIILIHQLWEARDLMTVYKTWQFVEKNKENDNAG